MVIVYSNPTYVHIFMAKGQAGVWIMGVGQRTGLSPSFEEGELIIFCPPQLFDT